MKQLFQNLGASEKEMRAWLKMLPLGTQPVSVMAKYAGVPRSSMYEILDRLKKIHLMEEYEQNGITYIRCVPVQEIADVLALKERQIEESRRVLKEKLPHLMAMENKLSITPKVRFFEGKKESMKVYEEVLKEKEFCAAFHPAYVKKMMPEYFDKVAEVLAQSRGKAKELLVACPEAREYQEKYASEHHQIKILPPGITFPSDTIICSNTIYMISYGDGQVCATEIRNPALAKTQRAFFELIWSAL